MSPEEPVIIVPEHPGTDTIKAPVLNVFDGDGFLTRIRASEVPGAASDQEEFETVARFGFIDAPELEQPGGREAKDFLTDLIGGNWVELVILMKMDTGRSVDSYGRIVCVPFLTLAYADNQFRTAAKRLHVAKSFGAPLLITRNIELEMVINGWAWVLERYGPDERYFQALDEAKRHRRGIWAFEDNIHPWEFKKRKYREARRNGTSPPDPKRPCQIDGCRGHLVKRNGRFGDFLSCSNYPSCKYTCSAAT
ncbi:topoisomerase DNA-binding C4 zinc finger domain-containing protein [Mesorhizobium sp. CA9]|nr:MULTISPECIES: topoisomerase DNA-binding C4 zinc finger domain-containing protein [unclassified Mesorhizobium]MBZ9734350.1 topoisomerase DNA-binding C4 zinc finger domain-containing protein [Mesorhizobium sp. CA9]MBZ9829411.1 topoisomerase DNA-binding C4 zinc finger domain-containing protein [Mesorhizobium sp. CA2]MBZ9877999.1 topoisomerase DNA-binding C4 zinc finger domain-containing protein [Mesorhizobium sp. Ca11]